MNIDKLRIGVIFDPWAAVDIRSAAVFCNDPEDIYFGPLTRAIDDAWGQMRLTASGREVCLHYAKVAPENYAAYARDHELGGLILISPTMALLDGLRHFADNNIPYVAIGGIPGPGADVSCIDASNVDAGKMAADYLIGLGHKRLGCVNLATDYTNHSDRMEGFQEAIIAAGLEVDYDLFLTDVGYEWYEFSNRTVDWFEHLTDRGDAPTAIFAVDFLMAEAALTGLAKNGWRVPDKISVIGFDDPPAAAQRTPPLTTIRQPVAAMGRRAVEKLVDALQDPYNPKMVPGIELLPTELTIRGSTAPPTA